MPETPLVSVVLATFNGEEFIAQQLDSLISQTYPTMEIIAVDDCSTDNTVNILRDYAVQHNCIKLFVNETNLGFIKNFEKGCLLASGDFISPCDQDDYWVPDKIQLMVADIGDAPLIYCDSFVCNEQLQHNRNKISDLVNCRTWDNCLNYAVFARIYGHTLLFKKELLQHIVPFTEVIPHDWWIAYHASLQGSVPFFPEALVYYRQHPKNVFGIIGQKSKMQSVKTKPVQKRKLEIEKVRTRMQLFYHRCPPALQLEKQVLKKLHKSYSRFSLSNNFLRVYLFFKYRRFFLAVKKYSPLHQVLFCLKMFVKIK